MGHSHHNLALQEAFMSKTLDFVQTFPGTTLMIVWLIAVFVHNLV